METLSKTVNGFKSKDIMDTVGAIQGNPDIAKFKFRTKNKWISGGHNRSTIQGFYGGCTEDETRSKPFVFDNTLLKQKQMAKSILYAGSSSVDEDEDSITFVKSIQFRESKNQGNLYFYKNESSYGSKWHIHYAGFMSLDTNEINTNLDFDFIDRKITVYNEKDIDEEINKIIAELYLRNRKRAKTYRH